MPFKKKNKKRQNVQEESKRALELKGPMEEYAKIIRMIGDGQIKVVLCDSREVSARIPGRFKRRGRKKVWMNPGDVILVSTRSFQNNIYDVVHRYKSDEIKSLVTMDEVPPFFCDAYAVTETSDLIEFDDNEVVVGAQPTHIDSNQTNFDNISSGDDYMSFDELPVDQLGNTV